MGGGLMQLVAYGAQDIYLTGNPQVTFFKIVYRRYTNFAIETIEHPFVGNPAFGNRVSAKITRSGDLITKIYIRVKLEHVNPHHSRFAWVKRLGHALIKYVDIEIGGTKIDKQYGTWLDIWYELARQGDHEKAYAHMIGNVPELIDYNKKIKPEYILYIPLQFWFNRFVGLAIPLIALQYHETILNVEFEEIEKLIITDCKFDHSSIKMKDASLLVNYVYLDTEERRRFALVGHEYLIEQLQFNGTQPVRFDEFKYILDFNFPTKELVWAVRNGNFSSKKRFIYYTGKKHWNIIKACKVVIKTSISVGVNPEAIVGGRWIEVPGEQYKNVGTFNINNKNFNPVFVNPQSLIIDNYNITNKIFADVIIDQEGEISSHNVTTNLTIRDFSIPLEYFKDTRYNSHDPKVVIFSNYGLLINGDINPVRSALLQFNGHDRFDTREGEYFNYVQPEQYHTNTPKDGINCYSFALFPEEHQPSGTSNLSRIETSTLKLTFHHDHFENFSENFNENFRFNKINKFVGNGDSDNDSDIESENELLNSQSHEQENDNFERQPSLHYFNEHNRLYIFALNYNILRIYSGLAGIAYVMY